ncbi:hypothetical protein AAG570_011214 [Ranatra chinensis]|uniref:Uncharacterized protein n=1 Tax=Ranatra chinensis TaxID=642074 RepID=A0ABD0YK01_9HEMI
MASKCLNMFYQNKKQETTEIVTCNLHSCCDCISCRPSEIAASSFQSREGLDKGQAKHPPDGMTCKANTCLPQVNGTGLSLYQVCTILSARNDNDVCQAGCVSEARLGERNTGVETTELGSIGNRTWFWKYYLQSVYYQLYFRIALSKVD